MTNPSRLQAANTETKLIICCACGQQCGVVVAVEEGQVIRISGDQQHPVSRGFICPKGTHADEMLYSNARVHWPLKRAGRRGEGRWERIGWDQALDEIAGQLKDLIGRHGPQTVAITTGTIHGADWGMSERFLNLLGSPNHVGQDKVCNGPVAIGEAITYGLGPTGYGRPIAGLTRCVVLWGMRPSASRPLLWAEMVKAHRAGAKLIVVDPLRTAEAKQADLFVQHRPGSDAALALGWLNVIINEGLIDQEFVRHRTVGFEALWARAMEYPPSRVAELTWVPEPIIVAAARTFAANAPALFTASNGLCQIGRSSVQAARAIACLIAITGNLERPGAHHLIGPPQKVIANGDAILADRLSRAQRDKRLGGDRFPLLGAGYRMFDEALARRWYGQRNIFSPYTSAHEPALWQAILERQPYPVTALFVQYRNPLGGSPNSHVVARALKSPNLELLVVHDLYKSPTAQYADYILPASHWLEKPFLSLGLAYMGLRGDYAEANPAAIPPGYEHRSDYDLWRELGRRFGQAGEWPERVEELWNQWLKPAGLTFDAVAERRGPWMELPARADHGEPAFATVTGKVELESQLLKHWGLDPLPGHEEPKIFRAHQHDYPLVLTTGGRVIEGFHHNAFQMPWFRRKFPDPVVQIHPRTAAAMGIEEGEWVAIETPVGRVTQRARLTDILHERVIQADRWWYPERNGAEPEVYGVFDTNINFVTDDDLEGCDPVMGAWPLRAMPARLARIAKAGQADGSP